jgi:hypothetical protein
VTGTILQLPASTRSGLIQAEDGSRVAFPASAVHLESGALAVGLRVRFDCVGGWSDATVVFVLRDFLSDALLDLRYTGFDQARNLRHYRFDAVGRGQAVRRFIVTADMELFLKHRVAMQEGPTLCLRKLMSDLESGSESARHELDNCDLAAYTQARVAAEQRKAARPKPSFHRQLRHGPPPPIPGTRSNGAR